MSGHQPSQRKVIESPFGGAQMIIKRNNRSRLGVWLEEKVNIVANYKIFLALSRRAFYTF